MGSLTEKQKSIIEGCLLGDGSMRCKTNALLEINHSLEQKPYVDWKYENLKDLVRTPPKAKIIGWVHSDILMKNDLKPGRLWVLFLDDYGTDPLLSNSCGIPSGARATKDLLKALKAARNGS